MSNHSCHFRLTALAGLLTVALATVAVAPAGADPIADKQAQAQALQEQIDATNQKISALGEQYNGAELHLEDAQAQVAAVQARIDATQAEVDRITHLVHDRGASVYRSVLAGRSVDGFDLNDATHLITRQHYAAVQASHDDDLLNQLSDAKDQLAQQHDAAEKARADADAERLRIQDAKSALDAANAQQQQLLAQTQGELAALVQQEMERRAAEALAAARARFGGNGGNPQDFPNLPPNGPIAAAAIEFARAQIAKTYVYAAAGPDHFDCSGLVMAAFRSAGVSLPHYSGAQYAMLPHVSLDNVQVGDLMFWGAGGSVHVAIYVGDARILESGGSGNDVHIGPIWGHPTGAARVPE